MAGNLRQGKNPDQGRKRDDSPLSLLQVKYQSTTPGQVALEHARIRELGGRNLLAPINPKPSSGREGPDEFFPLAIRSSQTAEFPSIS